ncbi:hypothetical protein GT348_05800 [Aristophania vespae]|uniref:Uncharacterized protein n=1 Tax=Aristophania vespae TaxID=2697033 RepID=A0A6P1NH31_9PROT|nr:hypothetical protein [Aristophania vespae]QHI95824.1 hypothetical protein GT348_05800 [Aristophania vespae]
MKKKTITLLGSILAVGVILLGADTALYFWTQSRITGHVEQIKLNAQKTGSQLRLDIAQRGGWPIGAWAKFSSPAMQLKTDNDLIAFSGTSMKIGGSWAFWSKSLFNPNALPLTLEGKSVLRLTSENGEKFLISDNAHFFIPKEIPLSGTYSSPFTFDSLTSIVTTSTHKAGVKLDSVKGQLTLNAAPNHHLRNIAFESHADTGHIGLEKYLSSTAIQKFHFAFGVNLDPDNADYPHHGKLLIQDLSYQLPQFALSSPEKGKVIPALALSGQMTMPDVSGRGTIKVDAWRDLIRSFYHQNGSAITGSDVTAESEIFLDHLLRIGQDENSLKQPLTMSIEFKDGDIVSFDSGALGNLISSLMGAFAGH